MNAGKVKAHGPGLEPKGNIVGQQAIFTVETVDAGKGTLEISILDPKGKQVKVRTRIFLFSNLHQKQLIPNVKSM